MADDTKFWMDMRKIKEEKHYTKPGFFSKDDISKLRGDWEVTGLWSKQTYTGKSQGDLDQLR